MTDCSTVASRGERNRGACTLYFVTNLCRLALRQFRTFDRIFPYKVTTKLRLVGCFTLVMNLIYVDRNLSKNNFLCTVTHSVKMCVGIINK